jgi:hypothetical protein
MEAKMANINSVANMPFTCENGGCNKRFRPLVPKLTLSPSSTAPMANAVWSTQQSHDPYNQLQQAFCSASSGNSVSVSAAACFLEPKISRLDGKADENSNQRNQIDRLIKGDQQNMKEEQAESCAVQSQPTASGTRWNPTPDQIRILEMFYKGGMRTPNAEQIEHITAQLRQYGKIEGKNVFYWFQNHKARERQKQKRNSSMQQVAATAAKKTPTTIITDNPNELHKPNSNGTYSLYNLPFTTMSEDSRLMFASSSLLALPCSKGLATSLAQVSVDVRTPATTGAKRDGLEVLKRSSHGPPQVQMNDEGSPSKNSMIWDSINSSGEGIITNLALSQVAADMPVNVNSCKRKNRLWQVMTPNEELGLHTESSSESICLQTSSDPINPSEYIDEEDHRELQTLQLFPLRPEGSLKSKGETNMDNSMLSLHVNPSSTCPYPFREINKSAESSTQKGAIFEDHKYSKAAEFFPNFSADYSFLNSMT